MDPLWLALSKLRRGKLDECISICDGILAENPGDQVAVFQFVRLFNFIIQIVDALLALWHKQAAWITKCKAVIKQNFIDDIELDEEGVAEMLLDENALASMPRYSAFPLLCLFGNL